MTRRAIALTTALALAVGGLGACGVTTEGEANRIDPEQVPFDLLAPRETVPTTVTATEGTEVIYLVRSAHLVPVARPGAATDALTLVGVLAEGPTREETSAGLRSALPEETVIDEVVRAGPQVTVRLSDRFAELSRMDQLLAAAQLTYTLTELAGVEQVELLRGDRPVAVPRPDGTVGEGPVTRRDFASLLS